MDEETPTTLETAEGEGVFVTGGSRRLRCVLLLIAAVLVLGAAVGAAVVVTSVRSAAATSGPQGNSSLAPVVFNAASTGTSCTNKDTGVSCIPPACKTDILLVGKNNVISAASCGNVVSGSYNNGACIAGVHSVIVHTQILVAQLTGATTWCRVQGTR